MDKRSLPNCWAKDKHTLCNVGASLLPLLDFPENKFKIFEDHRVLEYGLKKEQQQKHMKEAYKYYMT